MNWTLPSGPYAGYVGWNDRADTSTAPGIVEVDLGDLLNDMVADGRIPNAGVANAIMKQVEKAPLKALTNHLSGLVRGGVITQQTMDQILAMVAG